MYELSSIATYIAIAAVVIQLGLCLRFTRVAVRLMMLLINEERQERLARLALGTARLCRLQLVCTLALGTARLCRLQLVCAIRED